MSPVVNGCHQLLSGQHLSEQLSLRRLSSASNNVSTCSSTTEAPAPALRTRAQLWQGCWSSTALFAASWGRACRTCRWWGASGPGGTSEGPARRCNGPQVRASGVIHSPQDSDLEKPLHVVGREGGGGDE